MEQNWPFKRLETEFSLFGSLIPYNSFPATSTFKSIIVSIKNLFNRQEMQEEAFVREMEQFAATLDSPSNVVNQAKEFWKILNQKQETAGQSYESKISMASNKQELLIGALLFSAAKMKLNGLSQPESLVKFTQKILDNLFNKFS